MNLFIIFKGMLKHPSKQVREEAVELVLFARNNPDIAKEKTISRLMTDLKNPAANIRKVQASQIRYLINPKINFEATTIFDLIDLSKEPITPPPILRRWTDQELMSLIEEPWKLDLTQYPFHNQETEKFIREVRFTAVFIHFNYHRVSKLTAWNYFN